MCEKDKPPLPHIPRVDPRRPDSEIYRLLLTGELSEISNLLNGSHRIPTDTEVARITRTAELVHDTYADDTASGIYQHVRAIAAGHESDSRSYDLYFMTHGHVEAAVLLESKLEPQQQNVWQNLQIPKVERIIGRALVTRTLLRYEPSELLRQPLLLRGLDSDATDIYRTRGMNFGLRYAINPVNQAG